MVKKAYKGTISSIILSVVVLGILLVPFFTANHIQKVREGEGKYEFKATICWDVDEQEDFENNPDLPGFEPHETGALGCIKILNGLSGDFGDMMFEDNELEVTIDGYGIGTVPERISATEWSAYFVYLTFTRDDIIENDITRIDIFLAIAELNGCKFDVWITIYEDRELDDIYDDPDLHIGRMTMGELSRLKIDVNDIMKIYTIPEGEPLALMFIPSEDDCDIELNGFTAFFDMQFYKIHELKVTSLDWIGIAMSGVGMFMIFCSVLMLPQINFIGMFKKD